MSAQSATVPVSDIILDASQALRDDDCRKAGGKPFYMAQAYRAVRKMGFDTLFDTRRTDIDITGLVLDLPAGCIGLVDLFLFSGDACDMAHARHVRIKPNMYNRGGSGFLSRNMWRNEDILQWNAGWSCAPPRHLYFAGTDDKKIYLSASCLQYEKLHVVYSGLGVDEMGKSFNVPEWMAEAVTHFIQLKVAERLLQGNMQFYRDWISRMNSELNVNNTSGSWHQARTYFGRMDKKTRADMIQYMTRPSPR